MLTHKKQNLTIAQLGAYSRILAENKTRDAKFLRSTAFKERTARRTISRISPPNTTTQPIFLIPHAQESSHPLCSRSLPVPLRLRRSRISRQLFFEVQSR
mmetsp:Transcript_3816/g.14486  ORF Transcript_3816/g.14486 Transcript_3816/m.14486 type:complete len:100 (-) Transcript_3816:322-621(-)